MDDREYTERLAHDLAIWAREGLLTPEQEQGILVRIGAGEPRLVGALRLGWLVTAISIIGAIVMAAGVALFFGANWDSMPDGLRSSILIAGVIAAYGFGYVLTYRLGMDRVGGALLLLGALLFEVSLFLLADVYKMPVGSPLLLLAAIGVAPVAYAFGSRIVILLAIADAVGFVAWYLVQQYGDTAKSESALIVIGVVGIIVYSLGRLHAMWKAGARFTDVYVLSGALVTLGLVYVFAFEEPWQSMIDDGVEAYSAPVIVYVSIAVAAALVAMQWVLRARDIEANVEAGFLAAILGVACIVATWPAWTGYAIVFNIVYFAAAGGIVTRGYLQGDERYVNAGLVLVALGLLTRYADLFWPMLTGSAFFMIGGLLLLGLAFALERFRRTLLSGMGDDGATGASPSPTTGAAS